MGKGEIARYVSSATNWSNVVFVCFEEELDLSESRCIEFKAGPGFINNDFRNNVGKYACGFLNSHEDGTLMLGIEDSGIVKGYSINREKEDSMKCQFDNAMKEISPDVFPNDYSLRFVPVCDNKGDHFDNRYVIEICVRGSNIVKRDRLYECKLGVFLRRDGSLEGPLKAKKIQEWICQMFELRMKQMEEDQRNVQKELENRTSQLESERQKLDNHQKDQDRLRKLKRKNKHLKHENHSLKAKLHEGISYLNARIVQLENSQQNKNQHSDATMKELGEIKHLLTKKSQSKIFESKMEQKEKDQEELKNRISQLESERHQQSQVCAIM